MKFSNDSLRRIRICRVDRDGVQMKGEYEHLQIFARDLSEIQGSFHVTQRLRKRKMKATLRFKHFLNFSSNLDLYVFWFAGRSVGRSVGRSIGRSVGRSVGRSTFTYQIRHVNGFGRRKIQIGRSDRQHADAYEKRAWTGKTLKTEMKNFVLSLKNSNRKTKPLSIITVHQQIGIREPRIVAVITIHGNALQKG